MVMKAQSKTNKSFDLAYLFQNIAKLNIYLMKSQTEILIVDITNSK